MAQTVCPHCGAINRLPEGKSALEGRCGQCREALFTGAPLEVGGTGLDRHVARTKGHALLLDVWAPWCGPCRMMAPHFASAAQTLEPEVRLLKLNSDAEPQAAGRLGVSGIPALFLFRDGKTIARTAGLMTAPQLTTWTRDALNAPH